MYLYESHLGGLYTSLDEQSYDDCYCEQCGDSDWLLGYYDSGEEVLRALCDEIEIENEGGWNLQYILEVLSNDFNCNFTSEEAIKIVKQEREKGRK